MGPEVMDHKSLCTSTRSACLEEQKEDTEMLTEIIPEAKDNSPGHRQDQFLLEIDALQENLKMVQEMRELSLKAEGRESLLETNAVPTLVGYIQAIDFNTRYMIYQNEGEMNTIASLFFQLKLNALRALFNLSVVDSATRWQIVHAGAIPLLLRAAQTDNTEAQPAAVGTLANLATESDIKMLIVQNGLKPLLRLLRSHDIAVKAHACRALFAIAANDENKLAISDAGGLSLLLECMTVGNVQVQVNAAGALANLAIHPLNKPKLVESGALHILYQLAFSEYDKIQRQVARCLFALAAHADNRKHLVKSRCLTGLVYMLRTENEEVQRNAAGAIGNIAMSDELKLVVVEADTLGPLIELTKSPSVLVRRQSARAIFTLSAKEAIKDLIVKYNGLPSLVELISCSHEEIQRDSAGALANMAIGPGNKSLIIQHGALDPLILLLGSPHQMVQRQAARAVFALAGSSEHQEAIVCSGGLNALIKLLQSSPEVQKHAAGALANLANNYASSIIHAPGDALKMLIALIMQNSNCEVRRQANRAIINLLPSNANMPLFKSRYVGVVGEKQRLRHEMRALFEETIASTACDTISSPVFYDAVLLVPIGMNQTSRIHFHTNIVFGRCQKLSVVLVCQRTGFEQEENVSKFTSNSIHSKRIWECLFEFLYTDSIRYKSSQLNRSEVEALKGFADKLGLSRLVYICHEQLESKKPKQRPLLKSSLRSSTWVGDMEYITKCGLGFARGKTVFFQLETEDQPCQQQKSIKLTRRRRAQRISFEHSSPRHLELSIERVPNNCHGFPVHKDMLVARCPYFRAQFSSSFWSDSNCDKIKFTGSKACFMIILRYVYCGLDKSLVSRLCRHPELALEVLVYSNLYNLEGLFSFCESCLFGRVTNENACYLLNQIECIYAPLLRTHCIYVILKNGVQHKNLSSDLVSEISMYGKFWKFPDLVA